MHPRLHTSGRRFGVGASRARWRLRAAAAVLALGPLACATSGTPAATEPGAPDPAVIEAIRQRTNETRRCYETARLRDPTLRGGFLVTLDVDAEGRVTHASAERGSIPDEAMVQCVLDEVKTWRLPPPQGGAQRVQYPFKFDTGR
jgi:TonB family protein